MSNRDEINDRIGKLNYDPQTTLVFNGTTIKNIDVPFEGSFEDSTYLVVTREKCSYGANFDVAVPSAFQDVTYPGALLFATSKLLDGQPQQLAMERAELDFTVDLPGTSPLSFRTVPTFRNVHAKCNEIVANWIKEHGDKAEVPANFQLNSSLVYDENELALKFGCDVSYVKQKLGIDFTRKTTEKRSIYIVQFKQIFYTVSVERPSKPASVFAESVRWDDLVQAGVSERKPPLLVKNVQYGRQIFLKFESSLSSTDLEATVKATCSKGALEIDLHGSVEYKAKLSKINVSLVALGGSPSIFSDLNLGDIESVQKINQVILANTRLTAENPPAPLNYLALYLKDGASAGVFGKTEYVLEKTARYTGGELKLAHYGWYVAHFTVTWDEISYVGGVKQSTRKGWNGNGQDRTAPFTTVIAFRGNVRNICIKTEGCTGLAWEWWRVSGDKKDLPLVPSRSVTIGGTTLHQTFTMDPSA